MTRDPILGELAKRFNDLPDFDDPNGLLRNQWAEFEGLGKHIQKMPGGRGETLAMRFYFKGRNRLLAYAPVLRGADLCRFADMAELRFWKYRRAPAPPTDAQMNFSVAQATTDTEDNAEAVTLLGSIEKHLLDIGVFTPYIGEPATTRENRSVRGEFLASQRVLVDLITQVSQDVLEAVVGVNDNMRDDLKIVNKQLGGMANRLTAIESILKNLPPAS